MTTDNEPPIEVEVLEIDGVAPPKPRAADGIDPDGESAAGHAWTNWQRWPGQVRHLHPLWWPVLVVGGGLLLVIILTLVLILGTLLVIFRIIRNLLRALFS
ncbi:MAG: hypothetical protein NTW21_30245 [Verrucomicrobia bacterium]|nr:hypothetical protein [Verrucomicrobiota bacterium]